MEMLMRIYYLLGGVAIGALLASYGYLGFAHAQSPEFAQPTTKQAHALIQPMGQEARVGKSCQLLVTPDYVTPGAIVATDAVTGEVLFRIAAGRSVSESKCINAPAGHGLDVEAPYPETR